MHGTRQINGIIGIHHKLEVHDNLPPRREEREDNVPLRNACKCGLNEFNVNSQFVGNVDFNRLSSIARSTPSVTSDATNKKP